MTGIPLTAPTAAPDRPTGRDSWTFRPDVEGLRAVAIAAVVGYHVGLPLFAGGFVGVDVFFVISGFLITGLLAAEATSTGRVSLAGFWARRARRLLPAATLVLVTVALLAWFALPAIDHGTAGGDIVASALYVANMRFAVQATDYLAADASPSPVLHMWSLGVEEQFYVVWPLLVLAVTWLVLRLVAAGRRTAGAREARGPDSARDQCAVRHLRSAPGTTAEGPHDVRVRLVVALAALGVLSFVLSLRLTDRIEPWAFFGMPTRGWEFAIGGLVSLCAVQIGRAPVVVRRALGLVGALVLLGSIVLLSSDLPYPGTAAIWPVLGTAAVIASGTGGPGGLAVLTLWPVRAIGRLSYSWYLWHWPLLVLAASVWGAIATPVRLLVALLALVPSVLAYRFVERPVHHHAALVGNARRSLLTGAALSVTAALAGLALALAPGGGALASTDPAAPLAADEQTGRGPAALAPPESASPAPSGSVSTGTPAAPGAGPAAIVWPTGAIVPSPAKARGDIPIIYADGCHLPKPTVTHGDCAFGDTSASTTVVLFGDSHAAQWFPALDVLGKQHGFRLLVRTKSGCPAPDVTVFDRSLKRAYDECDTWRTAVMAEMTRTHPTLVLAAGTRTASLVDRGSGSRMAAGPAAAEWQAGWRRDLQQWAAAGVPVAVIRDTPWPGRDVPACVAKNLSHPSACDLSRDALDSTAYDVGLVRGSTTAHGIDLTAVICDPTRCPATRGSYLVYRDTSHLTATFSRALAPYLYRQLAPLLAR